MVNVGELTIGASIDTNEIEGGLLRIQIGLDNVDSKAAGVNSDFQRMVNTGKSLNKVLTGMGIIGAGSMIALAKGAPAVAGSMAQIEVETGKLQRSLGRGLAPVFDLAADAFSGFTGIVSANEGTLNQLSTLFSEEIRQEWNDAALVFGTMKDKIVELADVIGINKESISGFFTSFAESKTGGYLLGSVQNFLNPLGDIADLIRLSKEGDQNENRRTFGQMLRDWF